jgi:hypothetical protein
MSQPSYAVGPTGGAAAARDWLEKAARAKSTPS